MNSREPTGNPALDQASDWLDRAMVDVRMQLVRQLNAGELPLVVIIAPGGGRWFVRTTTPDAVALMEVLRRFLAELEAMPPEVLPDDRDQEHMT